MGGDSVNVGAHDVRLDLVALDSLRLAAVVDGVEHGVQFPGAFPLTQQGKRHRGPDGGMRVLPAVFAHAGHIALDIARFKRGSIEGRREQLNELGLPSHQPLVQRIHRLAGAAGVAAPGDDRPALADRIDLAFVVDGGAQGGAVIEPGPPIPGSIPGMSFDVAAQQRRLLGAEVGKSGLIAPPRQTGKKLQVLVQEPRQPNALALAVAADQIHAVIPVAAAHQRQLMLAKTQAVVDGTNTMFIEAGHFTRTLRLVVVGLLFRIEQTPFEKRDRFVEDAGIAGRQHIATGGIGEPQIVIGEMGAHPLSARRVPPVLHVALRELPRGAAEQLLAGQPGCGMEQRHGVLQLIAKPVGASGLVIAAAGPEPAGEGLVNQPAVGEHIQRGVGRLDLHRAQGAAPVFPHRLQGLPGAGRAAELPDQMLRLVGMAGRAKDEHDLALLPLGQLNPGLNRGARIEARAGSVRQALAAHRRRTGQRTVAADKLAAVAAHPALRLADLHKNDPIAALAAIGVAGQQRPAVRIRFGHDMHQIGVSPFTEHQLPISGQRQASRAPRLVAQFDDQKLHRCIHGDVGEQFGGDTGLEMFEHAVAKAVPADIAASPTGGEGRRRPEGPCILVPNIEGLAAAVA